MNENENGIFGAEEDTRPESPMPQQEQSSEPETAQAEPQVPEQDSQETAEKEKSAEQPPQADAQPFNSGAQQQTSAQYYQPPRPSYGNPQQGYGAPYQQQGYGAPASPYSPYSANNYANSYRPEQAMPNTPAKKKSKSGTAAFFIIVALVLMFAIVAGSAIMLRAKPSKGITNGDTEVTQRVKDDTEITIASTPDGDSAAAGSAMSTREIAANVKHSLVGIVVYNNYSSSSAGEGSGIIMGTDKTGKNTYIVTCAHVISGSGIKAKVQCEDGTTYDAKIVGYDIRTDIGVLSVAATGLKAAQFGDSEKLQVGDPVYAIGNPGGVEFFGSFTGGFVSAIDRPVSSEIGYTMKCIQHDAAINPGNSGGPLVNQFGQVVGINSQKITATNYEGMGFAIPITSAKGIIDDLINVGYVPDRPKLGITYYPVSASAQYSMIAQIKGLPAGTLIIDKINSDSSLANTQARQYDMIVAVNGEKLTSADVLLEKIDNGSVGDKLTLSLCRVNSDYSTTDFDVEVTLVEDKGNTAQEEATSYQYVDPFQYFYGN